MARKYDAVDWVWAKFSILLLNVADLLGDWGWKTLTRHADDFTYRAIFNKRMAQYGIRMAEPGEFLAPDVKLPTPNVPYDNPFVN